MNTPSGIATADFSPSAAILQIMTGFRVSRATYVAAKLGIADLLKDGPKSSEELAQLTDTHAPSLYRVMRALASVGVFGQDEQGRFALTPVAATLRSDVPNSLRALATISLGEERYQAWGDLMYSVRTGEIAFNQVFGMGLWEYYAQHPEQAKVFDESMANFIAANSAAVLASYPFLAIDTLVDVGGGNGSFIVSALQAYPRMKGVLFDLPHVAEQARKRIADAGLAERCEVIGGNIVASVPEGGTVYILSQVIHDWDDDRAIGILKSCHRAMKDKAKLLLVERILPAHVEQSVALQRAFMLDVHMMATTGGRERTESEYRALLDAAGFRVSKVVPTESEMIVVECVLV
jgi:O-methyltransferase domain/Dimerisation domain